MKLHGTFFRFDGRNPAQSEWLWWLDRYHEHETNGGEPNEFAAIHNLTGGTACRLKKLNQEWRSCL